MRKTNTDISRGSEETRIINLTSVPTEQALESTKLCETIRVKIQNLTPSQGPVTIPVRYTREDAYMLPIGYLEDVVMIWKATKAEFRLLKMMCDILKS